jgi:hypothetical protein
MTDIEKLKKCIERLLSTECCDHADSCCAEWCISCQQHLGAREDAVKLLKDIG